VNEKREKLPGTLETRPKKEIKTKTGSFWFENEDGLELQRRHRRKTRGNWGGCPLGYV